MLLRTVVYDRKKEVQILRFSVHGGKRSYCRRSSMMAGILKLLQPGGYKQRDAEMYL